MSEWRGRERESSERVGDQMQERILFAKFLASENKTPVIVNSEIANLGDWIKFTVGRPLITAKGNNLRWKEAVVRTKMTCSGKYFKKISGNIFNSGKLLFHVAW